MQREWNEKISLSDKILSERKLTQAKIAALQGIPFPLLLLHILILATNHTAKVDELQQNLRAAEEATDSANAELSQTVNELNRLKREIEKERHSTLHKTPPASPISTPTSPLPSLALSTPIPTLTLANRLQIDQIVAGNDISAVKRELRRIFRYLFHFIIKHI